MKRSEAPSGRNPHPDAGTLLDFSESRLDARSVAGITAHLGRCRKCRTRVAELLRLREQIPGRHLESPPDWLVAWALDLPRVHPRREPKRGILPVRLVFDSWKAIPAAARSAVAAPRRLVYRSGSHDLDIEVETLSPGFVRIHGQVLSGSLSREAEGPGAVRIIAGKRVVARAPLESDGRFRFDRLPSRKSCTLRVERMDLEIEVPDLEL